MAAPVISILSDSSKESVGSHVPRVILFGTIPTSIPAIPVVPAEVPIAPTDPIVAPKVGAVSIISPTGVLDLVDYSSSSNSDPLEDSLHVAPELPLVSPFLCSDNSEANNESGPVEQRPERHESLAPLSEFPLSLVVAPPEIRRRPAILVRTDEAIPFGRPYHTHPNGPGKLLTARKRVGPFPARRLAWRRVSHRSLDHHSSPYFTSYSSSSSSSSDSSSDISSGSSSYSYSDSSLVHSSGCDASGFYALEVCTIALADLPPRKRFRDSYSSKASGEEHMEIGMRVEVATSDIREDEEEFEAEASAGGMMEIEVDPLVTGGISEPTKGDAHDLECTLYDISRYMSKVPLDRITEFETAQRQLEAGQLMASGKRAGLANRVRSLGQENLRIQALLCIERDRVDSLRRHMALSQEEFCQVHRERDDTRKRLRRLELLVERRLGFSH
ncbi:hypothetical protein Tco_0997173 [Tanacetum coccineum]